MGTQADLVSFSETLLQNTFEWCIIRKFALLLPIYLGCLTLCTTWPFLWGLYTLTRDITLDISPRAGQQHKWYSLSAPSSLQVLLRWHPLDSQQLHLGVVTLNMCVVISFAHCTTQKLHNFEPSTLCSFFLCCLFSKAFASYQPFLNATPTIVPFFTPPRWKTILLPN